MPLSKARQAYKNRYPQVLQNILGEILDPHEKKTDFEYVTLFACYCA